MNHRLLFIQNIAGKIVCLFSETLCDNLAGFYVISKNKFLSYIIRQELFSESSQIFIKVLHKKIIKKYGPFL